MRLKSSALTITAICALLFSPSVRADAIVGEPAGAFVATTRDGKTFDLSALRGKVVIVNFWATWCPPCRDEMPALEGIWRQHHTEGLEVLAVSADGPRTRRDVNEVVRYFNLPVAMIEAVKKNELVNIAALPVTFVIGKDGKVVDVFSFETGPWNEAGLNEEVKALLAVKFEEKTEAKVEAKPETKPEAKAEIKAETKPDEKK